MTGSISNQNSFGIQSNIQAKNNFGLNFNAKSNNNTAYYAKKGEPMYMKEMDADEDGIVSFDEFKDYCQENDISAKEMVRMVEMANSYRTMQAQKKASKSIQNQSGNTAKNTETEAVYAKRGDGKYDEVMDTNNDDKVTYKEYIEYCKEHSKPQEKTETKIDENSEEEFKTVNKGKAVNAYAQNEAEMPEGKIEDLG